MEASDKVIKFYGAKNRRIFEIERRCMDRDGVVIRYLDAILPAGRILDIGAGDGFIAASLTHVNRLVAPLEPDYEMIDGSKSLPWTQGVEGFAHPDLRRDAKPGTLCAIDLITRL